MCQNLLLTGSSPALHNTIKFVWLHLERRDLKPKYGRSLKRVFPFPPPLGAPSWEELNFKSFLAPYSLAFHSSPGGWRRPTAAATTFCCYSLKGKIWFADVLKKWKPAWKFPNFKTTSNVSLSFRNKVKLFFSSYWLSSWKRLVIWAVWNDFLGIFYCLFLSSLYLQQFSISTHEFVNKYGSTVGRIWISIAFSSSSSSLLVFKASMIFTAVVFQVILWHFRDVTALFI